MNIALWLERAGLSHGDRPAIGHGTRVVRSYGELAHRVARLAGAPFLKIEATKSLKVNIDTIPMMVGVPAKSGKINAKTTKKSASVVQGLDGLPLDPPLGA